MSVQAYVPPLLVRLECELAIACALVVCAWVLASWGDAVDGLRVGPTVGLSEGGACSRLASGTWGSNGDGGGDFE